MSARINRELKEQQKSPFRQINAPGVTLVSRAGGDKGKLTLKFSGLIFNISRKT